jgi:hypothetical protein
MFTRGGLAWLGHSCGANSRWRSHLVDVVDGELTVVDSSGPQSEERAAL